MRQAPQDFVSARASSLRCYCDAVSCIARNCTQILEFTGCASVVRFAKSSYFAFTLRNRLLFFFVILLALTPLTSSGQTMTEFRSEQWGISLETPRSWQTLGTPAYPNIILWMARQRPTLTMMVSAEHLSTVPTVLQYARTTVALLRKNGFRVTAPQVHISSGAFWFDAETTDKFLRQAFFVQGKIGYSIILTGSSSRDRGTQIRTFDSVLRSITLFPPTQVAPTAPSDDPKPGEKEPAPT